MENFLPGRKTISFSRMSMFHGVMQLVNYNLLKNEKNTTLENLGMDGRIILKMNLKRNQLERHELSGSV